MLVHTPRKDIRRVRKAGHGEGITATTIQATEMNPGFPGQYWDEETQTHCNFNRDYIPRTGRYTQSDPIGLDWMEG